MPGSLLDCRVSGRPLSLQWGPQTKLNPSRKSDTSIHNFSLAVSGCNPHSMAKPSGQALLCRDCRPEELSVSCSGRKASSCLSGNPLSHPLPSKNESKSVVPFFFSFPVSTLICMVSFFPLHLTLASQLKSQGKVSRDWTIFPSALQSRSPRGARAQESWVCPLGATKRLDSRHPASWAVFPHPFNEGTWRGHL